MAVEVSELNSGPMHVQYDVIATGDSDTEAVITHNLGDVNAAVNLEMLSAHAWLKQWYVSARSENSVTLTGANEASSGAVGAQLRVTVFKFHSVLGG